MGPSWACFYTRPWPHKADAACKAWLTQLSMELHCGTIHDKFSIVTNHQASTLFVYSIYILLLLLLLLTRQEEYIIPSWSMMLADSVASAHNRHTQAYTFANMADTQLPNGVEQRGHWHADTAQPTSSVHGCLLGKICSTSPC